MRVVPHLVGLFVSLIAGLAIAWLSGSVGLGVVASMAVFLVAASLIRDRRERGGDAGRLRGREARVEARNAAAYSQSSHGGYFGGDGGGGGCDGGGGGSC